MSEALVSILMPCYNAANHVEEAMTSILNQTHRNLEIIAINDCSTDNTGDLLYAMAQQDSRIQVFDNEANLRLIATLNKGIGLCSGEYIARMDADDIALPERIAKELHFLKENNDHDIVSSLFLAFDTNKPEKKSLHHNPLRHEELRAYMLFKSGICHPAVMMRKRIFTELGLAFEQEYLHVEDYALWSRAIYKTKIANIREPLLLYRVHNSQVSALNEKLQVENKKKVFEIHCEELGISVSCRLLDVYASVAECVPSEQSRGYLGECERFMLDLIFVNTRSPFCDMEYLKGMLAIHWLRLCANSQLGLGVVGMLKQSTLYRRDRYSRNDMLILYVKCLFKIGYKKSFIYKILFR